MLAPIKVEYNLQSAEYYFATLMDQLVEETMQLEPVDSAFTEQVNQLFYTIEAVRFFVDRGIFTENPNCLAVYNLMMSQIGIFTTLPDLSVDNSLVVPGTDFTIPYIGPQGPQGPQGATGAQGPMAPSGPSIFSGSYDISTFTYYSPSYVYKDIVFDEPFEDANYTVLATIEQPSNVDPTRRNNGWFVSGTSNQTVNGFRLFFANTGIVDPNLAFVKVRVYPLGYVGAIGPQGNQGPQGPSGGPQGPQGPTGPVYNPSPVTYSYTGADPNFSFNLIAPQKIQIKDTVYDGGQVWVDDLEPNLNPNIINTGFEFNNLNGIDNIFDLSYFKTTNVSFPVLKYIRNLRGVSISSVSSISLPQLISGENINITGSGLTSFNVPSLLISSSLLALIGNPSLTSVSAPQLKYAKDISFNNNALLVSINLQSLEILTSTSTATFFANGSMSVNSNPALSTVNISSLKYTNNLDISTNISLTSLNFSNLIGVTFFFQCRNNTSLTTVTINSGLKFFAIANTGVDFSNNALNQASVDEILVRLAALDGTNATTIFQNTPVNLTGGTNATPSATGLAAKATLVARGCTVTNN